MQDKTIIFDVGANIGSDSYHFSRNPNCIVYAFEPTPHLLNTCLFPRQDANFIVIPKAVSDFNGKAIFKIAGQADWGCSSLNEFSEDLDKTWAGRTDFKVTEEIEVDVITLENFIEEHNISHINFLHIDTQGSDLAVLRGIGRHLNKVLTGVIEVPMSADIALYKGQHTKEEALEFLEKNNFRITNIVPQHNEENVFFERK